MIIEAVVGSDVVVEVHLAVEVGVAVVGVLHENRGRVDGLPVERGAGAVDGFEVARLDGPKRRVVGGIVAGTGRGEAASGPGAAVAGGVDHRLDGGELRRPGV